MTIQDIKNFLETEPLIKQLKLSGNRPTRYNPNKPILSKIISNNNLNIRSNNELIYLLKHKDNLEDLHIFCNCGNKNPFDGIIYKYHCCRSCGTKYSREKAYNTCYKRYNNKYYTNPNKREATNLKRYNHPHYTNRTKARNTCNILYGDEFYNNRPKMKETNMKRRGVDSYSKTMEYKEKMSSKIENINRKRYQTRKKNGTYGTSNAEDMIYQFLIHKFNFEDIIHHYYDKERYPFECDFYIKSLDLFIELNFYWTHGFEPYDKNNLNHQEQLNNWIKKSKEIDFKNELKKQYNKAIYIWTIDDPNKLATFKRNNLNYKIFYNLEEFLEWFNLYYC